MLVSRVIVPVDGSAMAEQALEYALPLVQAFGASLTVLRIVGGREGSVRTLALAGSQPGAMMDPATVEMITEEAEEGEHEAQRYVEALAARLAERGVKVESLVREGSPVAGILEETKRVPGTMLALTTHGRTGLNRLLFGSVAEAVVKRSPGPVLVVRSFAVESAEQE